MYVSPVVIAILDHVQIFVFYVGGRCCACGRGTFPFGRSCYVGWIAMCKDNGLQGSSASAICESQCSDLPSSSRPTLTSGPTFGKEEGSEEGV